MRVLVFDTETTGMHDFKSAVSAEHQPDIVQIAARLYHYGLKSTTINVFVTPEKEITPEAMKTHNLEKHYLKEVGVSRRVALALFNNLLKVTDLLVAHNLNFDMNILRTGYHREDVSPDILLSKKQFCTMRASTDILKLPGKYGNKWPSLDEAYRHLVDTSGFDGAHDAMVDVVACAQVFFALQDKGVAPK